MRHKKTSVSRGVGMTDVERTHLRRRSVGFVFQRYNLVPMLTADDNIAIACAIVGRTPERDAQFDQILELLGLEERLNHKPLHFLGASSSASPLLARS
jgi:putative ABC transport system ATP-binding protein